MKQILLSQVLRCANWGTSLWRCNLHKIFQIASRQTKILTQSRSRAPVLTYCTVHCHTLPRSWPEKANREAEEEVRIDFSNLSSILPHLGMSQSPPHLPMSLVMYTSHLLFAICQRNYQKERSKCPKHRKSVNTPAIDYESFTLRILPSPHPRFSFPHSQPLPFPWGRKIPCSMGQNLKF
jgi:hypothetical protein